MAWCLLQSKANDFIKALQKGELDPMKIANLSSEDRHSLLSKYVGEENAGNVNALYESKLLLKDQQQGMISWIKRTIKDPNSRSDLVDKVNNLDQVLNPEEGKQFLKDLASSKIKADVTQEEAKGIYDLAKQAQEAKILDQTVKANRIAYGNKLIDLQEHIDSLKPQKPLLSFDNLWSLPNSALTSVLHFSSSFVQAGGMMSTKEFWGGFVNQFKYFAKPQAYKDLMADILTHPDYSLAKEAKLGITKLGDQLNNREEAMRSSLLEHIPGVGKLVKASSRAFTGELNYIRFTRFTNLLDSARLRGEDIAKGSKNVREIAKVVNDFTGRGALGTEDRYANTASILNKGLFSPRKISATINMFDPRTYLDPRISRTARIAAIKQLSGMLIGTGVILELSHLSGAKINTTDPTNTDYLKPTWGKTSIDVTGGKIGYARLLARIFAGKSTTSSGKVSQFGTGFGQQTAADQVIKFFRDKLSPVASTLADKLYGQDPAGNPFSVKTEAYNKLVPIVTQDFINLARNDPQNSVPWLAKLGAIFGIGMETQNPNAKAKDWNQAPTKAQSAFQNKVGQDKFKQANQDFNNQYNIWLKNIVNSPSYQKMSAQDQQSLKVSKESDLQAKIFKSYGFKYKAPAQDKNQSLQRKATFKKLL